MDKLSIIIPFLNEEKTIAEVLKKLRKLPLNIEKEIILVNDGSIDASEKIIQNEIKIDAPHTTYIYFKNDRNYGKGFSLKRGFSLATGDYMIVQDADLEYVPTEYILLLDKIKTKKLDFVYGSRTKGYLVNGFKYSYLTFLLGGLLVSFLVSICSFKIVSDEPTCYKMFSKKLKPYLLQIEEDGFEWEPAITILLLKKGFGYGEVPISYFPRKATEGKKIKRIDGWKAIKAIFKRRYFK